MFGPCYDRRGENGSAYVYFRKIRKSVEKPDSSKGSTHVFTEVWPPHDSENPKFIENWDISVLRGPVNARSCERTVD